MDKTVAFAVAFQIGGHFTTQNASEHRKCVVDGFCVDVFVEIFNENVSGARPTD